MFIDSLVREIVHPAAELRFDPSKARTAARSGWMFCASMRSSGASYRAPRRYRLHLPMVSRAHKVRELSHSSRSLSLARLRRSRACMGAPWASHMDCLSSKIEAP